MEHCHEQPGALLYAWRALVVFPNAPPPGPMLKLCLFMSTGYSIQSCGARWNGSSGIRWPSAEASPAPILGSIYADMLDVGMFPVAGFGHSGRFLTVTPQIQG